MSTAAAMAATPMSAARSTRDQLILEHMPLVRTIAAAMRRAVPVNVELDDLAHAGMLGLIDAAEKFQATKDVAFASYAKHRIRGAILDSMRRADRVSRDGRKRYKQVQATREALAAKLHREPSEQEIAAELGIDAERWREMMVDFHHIQAASGRSRGERDDERPLQNVPSLANDSPEHAFARTQMGSKLNSVMSSLPERYREVVKAYYHRDLTMREIAAELGVGESRVSQIHKSALALMQSMLAEGGFSDIIALAA